MMLSRTLLFGFEGHETATRKDLVMALVSFVPSRLVYCGVFAKLSFLVARKGKGWTTITIMGVQLTVLFSTLRI
jgi:hypothetical protein